MLETGTVVDKFIVETKNGREWYLGILMKNNTSYNKKISKSTYDKKKVGDSFQYFTSTNREYLS